MPRNVPTALATHLAGGNTTICNLLKIKPVALSQAPLFGLCTLDQDVIYDDGSGDGPVTYKAKRGFTPLDLDTRADLSIDNTEASGLVAEYPADGVTMEGVGRGDYDNARFVMYLVNYNNLTSGQHVILQSGQVGQIKVMNGQTIGMELRSLTQILKQNSLIELTSITDRAKYGDERNKMTLYWYNSTVASLGAEDDRTFVMATLPGSPDVPGSITATVTGVQFGTGDGTKTAAQLVDTAGLPVPAGFTVTAIKKNGTTLTVTTDYTISTGGLVTFVAAPASGAVLTWDGTLPISPDGFFVPGVVHWLTGANTGRENEVETYIPATGVITLAIPTREPMVAGDTFKIRRDSDKSKTRAIADNNLPNMRAEPELPRGDGMDLQAPTPGGQG